MTHSECFCVNMHGDCKLELSEDLTIAPLLSFFSSVRKTMTGNNPKLDLVHVDARKKRLVRFCQFILKILSGNEILTSIKGRNSLKIY